MLFEDIMDKFLTLIRIKIILIITEYLKGLHENKNEVRYKSLYGDMS